MKNELARLTREKFGSVLKMAIKEAELTSTLPNGFQTRRLYPFLADGINYNKFFENSVVTIPELRMNGVGKNSAVIIFFS